MGFLGMSDLGSKKEGKGAVPGQPAEEAVTSDIEKVLNFLGPEEYQDGRQPIPYTKKELKRHSGDKTRHDASKPLTPGIDSVKSSQQKDSAITTARRGKVSRPPPIEKKPIKKALAPLDGTKGKKSGKIWFLCLSTAILIFLAILILYKTGYPFAGV